MENLFKRGMIVKLNKKKGIIPDKTSVLNFWKEFRDSVNSPKFYKDMNDEEFSSYKLKEYENRVCLNCACLNDKDCHPEYVVFFLDPISNQITGEQETHVCERHLKLWKD